MARFAAASLMPSSTLPTDAGPVTTEIMAIRYQVRIRHIRIGTVPNAARVSPPLTTCAESQVQRPMHHNHDRVHVPWFGPNRAQASFVLPTESRLWSIDLAGEG